MSPSLPTQKHSVLPLSSSSLERVIQVGEASLCPSSGGCSRHVLEPSCSGSETGLGAAPGRQIQGQEPDGTRPYLMFTCVLLVWSDTPAPSVIPRPQGCLGSCDPGAPLTHPQPKANDVSTGGFRQPVTCWGLPEASLEKECMFSTETTTQLVLFYSFFFFLNEACFK